MEMNSGDTLLNGKYTLSRLLNSSNHFSMWRGHDAFRQELLIKVWNWSSTEAAPDEVQRRLWDRELRQLYRLANAAGAATHLVVLHDAGIDRDFRCFVLVLKAPGLERLSEAISATRTCRWLRELGQESTRAEVWRGFQRLARGLDLLHRMQVLHRAISPEVVFLEPDEGPTTFRLGGFEWTIRLGQLPAPHLVSNRCEEPPHDEASSNPFSFSTDWYAFGVTIGRVLLGAPDDCDATELYALLTKHPILTSREKYFLNRLLSPNPQARLDRGYLVVGEIQELIDVLDRPERKKDGTGVALAVSLAPGSKIASFLTTCNERLSATDEMGLRDYLQTRLNAPDACLRIVCARDGTHDRYYLLGAGIPLRLRPFENSDTGDRTWDVAVAIERENVSYCGGPEYEKELTGVHIQVLTIREVYRNMDTIKRSSTSWNTFLPTGEEAITREPGDVIFHDFLRLTNQLDILLADSELFCYEVIAPQSGKPHDDAWNRSLLTGPLIVREGSRTRSAFELARRHQTMLDFLEHLSSEKGEQLRLYLGEEDTLALQDIPESHCWTISEIREERGEIVLERGPDPTLRKVPEKGILRARDMIGQLALISRRKDAIDRLEMHEFLLHALWRPDHVTIYDFQAQLPAPNVIAHLDEDKKGVLQRIWCTRPIFTLEGPPGSGKTTLVANLLRQILAEDPAAQILVTAQANDAVDVLRRAVDAVFAGLPDAEKPIAIRLARRKALVELFNHQDASSTSVCIELLERTKRSLEIATATNAPTALLKEWADMVSEVMRQLHSPAIDEEGAAADFRRLVERSANITYCSSTAGDLAALAESYQMFDWSIIEEAGKAHGFELILPLQTGHRWVLIGDQRQLPPYRYEDFQKMIDQLDEAMKALDRMPNMPFLDRDLIRDWVRRYSSDEKQRRVLACKDWLYTFDRLFECCRNKVKLDWNQVARVRAVDPPRSTVARNEGLAFMLSHQHRMHPHIADLVSHTFYGGEIVSSTVNEQGEPKATVLHPFVKPTGIAGKAVVWVDVPWQKGWRSQSQHVSHLERDALMRFLRVLDTTGGSPDPSLRLTVLSPYRRQVHEVIAPSMRRDFMPHQPHWLSEYMRGEYPTHTVDSFQGNQADIVVVSLVRNNNATVIEKAFGFLKDTKRMNVLFSRAIKLMVLVGSWEFFYHHTRSVPSDPEHPNGHWRIAIDMLERYFEEEKAMLLRSHELR